MNAGRVSEKPRMYGDLISWQTAVGAVIAILGIIFSAAIYEWIRNPNIIWLIVACFIVLELYGTKVLIDYLKQRKDDSVKPSHNELVAPTTVPTSEPVALFPKDGIDDNLPGFSLHFYIRLANLFVPRRKYICDLGRIDAERLSLYVSSCND